MSAPAPAPAAAATAATPATAPTAGTAAAAPSLTPAQVEAAKNEKLFKQDTTPAKGSEPPTKKRRVQIRIEQDPSIKPILQSVVGTRANKFTDGLISAETIVVLKSLWAKLDFVQDGVLKQILFQNVRGIDPIWEQLLEACDVDGDGNITPTEFVAGFVFEALNKPLVMPAGGASVTGFEVIKALQTVLNQHLLAEAKIIKDKMGWS